jgi:hypothetical protein
MSQLMTQDVVHTDEMMVRDLVMQDINTFRITAATADFHKRRDELEILIHDEFKKDVDERDLTQISLWQTQLTSYSAALVQLTKEYSDAQSKKDAIFKALKTTRDQRYKEIKESGKDIFSLIMTLDTIEKREQEGRMAELIHMSAEKTKDDWSGWHEFEDGDMDSILLSAESLEKRDVFDSIANAMNEIDDKDKPINKNKEQEQKEKEND